MSVLIKGMEMPKRPIWIVMSPDGTVEYQNDEGWGILKEAALPVPPHGRLIDADAIPFVESDNGCQDDYAFRYDINEMQTIIPAEGVDDEIHKTR